MKEGRERIDEESSLRDMKPKDTVSAGFAIGPTLKRTLLNSPCSRLTFFPDPPRSTPPPPPPPPPPSSARTFLFLSLISSNLSLTALTAGKLVHPPGTSPS